MKRGRVQRKHTRERPEESPSKMVKVSDGHRVSSKAYAEGKTDCGEWRTGWRYGLEDDVLCPKCKLNA